MYAVKDLFGIQVIVNANAVNLALLVNRLFRLEIQKKIVDPSVEECTENIDETKSVNITVENENKDRCIISTVYRVLFWISFIFIIISSGIIYFVYRKYVDCNKHDLPY